MTSKIEDRNHVRCENSSNNIRFIITTEMGGFIILPAEIYTDSVVTKIISMC